MQRRSSFFLSNAFMACLAGLIAATLPLPTVAASSGNAASPLISSRWIRSSDGARLHVLQARPRTGPVDGVVVLVPGWSMPASLWRPQLQALGQRHRVLALDPRGQGESEIPKSGYDIDQRADDLADLLNRHERVVLVGWSLGALESLQYLHRHGEARLAGLVLVDSSVGEGSPGEPSQFPAELRRNRRGTIEAFVKAIFKSPRPAREQRALVNQALRMPLEASLTLFPSSVPREHWRDTVRGYQGPLLYVVTPQFAGQARELAAARPGTQTRVFDKAGHALFVDEPAAFNRLLEDFIARAAPPGGTGR